MDATPHDSAESHHPAAIRVLRKEAGLTLTELAVAIAVFMTLTGIGVPAVLKETARAKVQSSRKEVAGVRAALRAYAQDCGFDPANVKWGRFPPEEPGGGNYPTILGRELDTEIAGDGGQPSLPRGWNGPYISSKEEVHHALGNDQSIEVRTYQVDSWGRYYQYRNRNATGGFVDGRDTTRVVELISGGPDRDPTTDEDNIRMQVFRGPIRESNP